MAQLNTHVEDEYRNDHPKANDEEIELHSAWVLESSEEVLESFLHGSNESAALRERWKLAEFEEEAAKGALLEFSSKQGLNQFALYGLRLHVNKVIPKFELVQKTLQAEADLRAIDYLVRSNTGEILTFVNVMGAYAGRLGEGGITIINDQHLLIPTVTNTKVYAQSITQDFDLMVLDRLLVPAYDVHSVLGGEEARVMTWPEVLRIDGRLWEDGATFVLGEAVEGPPLLPAGENKEYSARVFEKIRIATQAAAA